MQLLAYAVTDVATTVREDYSADGDAWSSKCIVQWLFGGTEMSKTDLDNPQISLTNMLDLVPTDGAKTALLVSATPMASRT